jgi:hypothetical protein
MKAWDDVGHGHDAGVRKARLVAHLDERLDEYILLQHSLEVI